MSYTLNKTGAQIDAILNRAEAGGQLDLDIAAEAAARAAADALKAPLASPALTGTPTAPTAAPGTDTTQLATTAFANAAAAAAAASAASGKADKVAGAIAGNLAGLDASGNLTDAGVAAADVATKADVQNITPKRTASNDPSSSSFSVLCDTAIAGQARPKMFGKSVVINQLFGSSNMRDVATQGVTISHTITDGIIKYTITGTASTSANIWLDHFPALAGRTYYVSTSNANTKVYFYTSSDAQEVIYTMSASAEGYFGIHIISGKTYNDTFYLKCIDLTACGFSSAETTDVTTLKAAWLAKFGYPLPVYLPYDAGSIVSNNATYLMRGRNLWDEEWESGTINSTTGQNEANAGLFRSKNYIPVRGSVCVYYGSYASSNPYTTLVLYQYDANKQYIAVTAIALSGKASVYTLNEQTAFVRFRSGGTTAQASYQGDICFNVPDTSFNGQHEPYYNGGSVTADSLNGIGTAVDSQDAEGQIVRKIGSVDLGTLTWELSSAANTFIGTISDMQPLADYSNARVVCGRYQAVAGTSPDGVPDKAVCQRPHASLRQVYIHDSAYSTAAAFKTAVNGVMLDFILATPTTSTTSAASIQTQAGYNSLDPVSGDVQSADAEVEYGVDVIAYIDKKLAEL